MEQITFQNISCYCLTFGTEDRMENIIISKHLMLLFNTRVEAISQEVNKFQNISCYCLTCFRNQ